MTAATYGSWLPIRVSGVADTLADATMPEAAAHQRDPRTPTKTSEVE
jgi:hypothetical protein